MTELMGDSPDRRVELLCEHDGLHATWSRFGPGRDGADLHVHHHHADLFYVLTGEFTLKLGPDGREVAVPAGTLVRVPPMVVHGFRNGSDAEVAYLNFHAPGMGFADFLRDLRDGRPAAYDQHDPPADGGRPTAEATIGPPAGDVEAVSGEPGDAVGGRLYVLEGELALGGGLRAPAGSWVELDGADVLARPARYLSVRL